MKNSRLLTQVRNLLGSRELTPVRTPPGVTQLLPRGPSRGFGTWKALLVLTALLTGAPLFSPFLHAATTPLPTLIAGNATVLPGGTVSVPITVTGFAGVTGIQFSLTWNSGLLTLQLPTPTGLLATTGFSLFNTSTPGTLTGAWIDVSGLTEPDNTVILDVQFTASATLGQTALTWGSDPTQLIVSNTNTSGLPPTVNGSVIVAVPEPVNWALGLFVCVLIGGATVRWASSRRMSLQPAQTAAHGEPGA